MDPTGPGARAAELPWFWPGAGSLVALAESPDDGPWTAVRHDFGAVTLLLAHSNGPHGLSARPCREVYRRAAWMLSTGAGTWVDWSCPALSPVSRTALAAARFAELVAVRTRACDPAAAWCGGLLAYSGWLAVAATDASAINRCVTTGTFAADPWRAQWAAWGLTGREVADQLSRAWPLPTWARIVAGRLSLPPADAAAVGGDRGLQAVVQTAVVLAEQAEARLFVADEFDLAAAFAELRVQTTDLDRIRDEYAGLEPTATLLARGSTDPRQTFGLLDPIRRAADLPARRRRPPAAVEDVFAERLQSAKLAALAEFAAGASHEINNPLAVISGRSQYLLRHEADSGRRQALQSIVRQTERIHGILVELMQFARPSAPARERVDAARIAAAAAADLAGLATEMDVRIEVYAAGAPIWIDGDPHQLHTAVTALARNGVEAAGPGGWVRLKAVVRPDGVDIVVEDSGPGPADADRDHLFDPFFSGRSAGRGRGLGLPTAWRLAREHGGNVTFAPAPGGPTRFVLRLPPVCHTAGEGRKIA